jgi:hypothetical protein
VYGNLVTRSVYVNENFGTKMGQLGTALGLEIVAFGIFSLSWKSNMYSEYSFINTLQM